MEQFTFVAWKHTHRQTCFWNNIFRFWGPLNVYLDLIVIGANAVGNKKLNMDISVENSKTTVQERYTFWTYTYRTAYDVCIMLMGRIVIPIAFISSKTSIKKFNYNSF